ncbi:MAG TPA: GNAT family N-acetyltransferase [Spirochaetota bacterium]|nr:GNAT family N-acetyltransferase [Spirochaetota bacterium]HOR44551.1 GNAT family N-acetyltransferase [Spirochaetota bacterium]HPK56408.1 GNAT family N-acetyltransferase [Spirochaetota bacterium]
MRITYKELLKSDYDSSFFLWKKTEGMSLSNADTLEQFESFIKLNHGLSYGAFDEDKLVGTVLCGTDGRRGYIYHLAVENEYRRMNIGTKLVSLSIEALKIKGIEKCHIFVFKNNESGNNFWKKSGWKKRDDINVFSIE